MSNNPPNSVIEELEQHIVERINDGVVTDDNFDDLHFHCFNEDYYIVYHAEAEKWLAKHGISAFEAIDYVKDQQENHFGESSWGGKNIDPETVVNQYVYFAGYDAMPQADNVAEVLEALEVSE